MLSGGKFEELDAMRLEMWNEKCDRRMEMWYAMGYKLRNVKCDGIEIVKCEMW